MPVGFYRKAKDGEPCNKVDLAAIRAVVPGIALGPSTGVTKGALSCDLTVSSPSFVDVGVAAAMFASAEDAKKEYDGFLNQFPSWRKLSLAATKAEANTTKEYLVLLDQNMLLSAHWYAADKALLTEKFSETVGATADSLLAVLRKDLQSTTGPSASAKPVQRRVSTPDAVHGRKGGLADLKADEIRFILQRSLDELDKSPAIAMAYGTTSANNVLVMGATLAELTQAAQIDSVLARLAVEGITLSRSSTEKLGDGTEIRCGEAKLKDLAGALCVWRDNFSIGIAAFPGQKPADVKADFLTLRELVTRG